MVITYSRVWINRPGKVVDPARDQLNRENEYSPVPVRAYYVTRAEGVWFVDVVTSFSGVTFVLFCHVFVFMLSLKPRPFFQSSFDMQAPR